VLLNRLGRLEARIAAIEDHLAPRPRPQPVIDGDGQPVKRGRGRLPGTRSRPEAVLSTGHAVRI